jgi:hypothetical protein
VVVALAGDMLALPVAAAVVLVAVELSKRANSVARSNMQAQTVACPLCTDQCEWEYVLRKRTAAVWKRPQYVALRVAQWVVAVPFGHFRNVFLCEAKTQRVRMRVVPVREATERPLPVLSSEPCHRGFPRLPSSRQSPLL